MSIWFGLGASVSSSCGFLVWYGTKVTWANYTKNTYDFFKLRGVPIYPIYAIIPIGSLLWLIQLLRTSPNRAPAESPPTRPKGRCLRHRKDSDDGMVRCLLLLMGSFFLLVILGVPIVFAFLGVNVFFLGCSWARPDFELLIAASTAACRYSCLLPITLFILHGRSPVPDRRRDRR